MVLLRSRKEARRVGWGLGQVEAEGRPASKKEAGLDPAGKEFGFILNGQERLFGGC